MAAPSSVSMLTFLIKKVIYPRPPPPPGRLAAQKGPRRGWVSRGYSLLSPPLRAQRSFVFSTRLLIPPFKSPFQSRRPVARRLGPQGNRHRRARDAGPDVDPQEIRRGQAAQRRARHRLAAHDDPDRRADRDAEGHRRRRALGLVQHFLDPGPRRRRDRQDRHAGVRLEGRDAGGILGSARSTRSPFPAARARSSSSTTAATSPC